MSIVAILVELATGLLIQALFSLSLMLDAWDRARTELRGHRRAPQRLAIAAP